MPRPRCSRRSWPTFANLHPHSLNRVLRFGIETALRSKGRVLAWPSGVGSRSSAADLPPFRKPRSRHRSSSFSRVFDGNRHRPAGCDLPGLCGLLSSCCAVLGLPHSCHTSGSNEHRFVLKGGRDAFTRQGSQVQTLHRPPEKSTTYGAIWHRRRLRWGKSWGKAVG